jgi:hypothetical protein
MEPAIRCNLFFLKEKKKRIFTFIGAKERDSPLLETFRIKKSSN